MKKIFVATDFSEASVNAVRYAASLALDSKSALTIVHVYESPMFYTAEMPYTAIEAAEKMAQNDAETKMTQLLTDLSKDFSSLTVAKVIKRGISAEAITTEAEENGADLLVAGSTGAGMIERTLIGSTTSALINKSKCMVLIIPSGVQYKGINKMAYTTDLHDKNIAAANNLIPIATKANSELIFLFVDNKIHTDSEELSDEMAEKIRTHINFPKISGYVCTDADIMNGITIFIEKLNVDLVVMLTHPRSFPRMLWDKSLTKKFSYHPGIPLLVMHAAS